MRPTLYDYAGGAPALLALATAHHRRCLADPGLHHPFSRDDLNPEHVQRLAAYLGEVLGGPVSPSVGDHSAMLRMHAGNGDMDDLGRRFIDCFVAALDDAGLPQDGDFRAAMGAYMEWAVADVLAYPGAPSTVPDDLPMPRWSWDGLEPTAKRAPWQHPCRR